MTSPRLRAGAFLLAATTASVVSLSASAAADTAAAGWYRPRCGVVTGDGSVTFTRTDGAVLARTSTALAPVTYSKLIALSTPNTLVAISKTSIQRSTDAGCSWQQIGSAKQDLATYELTAGPDGTAYAYGVNDQPIYRVQGDQVSILSGPVADDGVVGLAVDPADPRSLRAVSKAGQLYDSPDGGTTWAPVGLLSGKEQFLYKAAIDPVDPDHVVTGTMGDGSFVTFDGGRSWAPSTGVGSIGRSNNFNVVISPTDPRIVWLEGYDEGGSGDGARHIWRSTDGGRSFVSMLDGNRAMLTNGNPMWPSPVDPDVLYFEFGTSFAGYGTDLYRYEASTDRLTLQHNDYHGITSVAFNPIDARVMYLGVVREL